MPTKRAAPDPLREMAAAAIASDPELRARIVRIVNLMLDDVEDTFYIGDLKDKAIYVRQIVPTLIRSLSEADATSVDDGRREMYERVMRAVRGDE